MRSAASRSALFAFPLLLAFALLVFLPPPPPTPTGTGLVGFRSFDDGTGTQATDFSGNGNTGILSTTGSTLPQWVSGKH